METIDRITVKGVVYLILPTILKIEPTETTLELSPNKFYKFGEVTNLTLTLGLEIEGIYNEYMFLFNSGSTPTTLSLPDTIKWIGDNTIEPNKIYLVSIVNNMAILGGVNNE